MRNFFDLSWRFEQCQNKYPTNQLIINPLMAKRLSARLFCNLQGYGRFQMFFRNFKEKLNVKSGEKIFCSWSEMNEKFRTAQIDQLNKFDRKNYEPRSKP